MSELRTITVPRFVVAAPRSGEGKTTVALGLMAALRQRGLVVQGYKVGPDYLDTGYQRYAANYPGRNLDLFMMGETAVERALAETNADIAVVEGVMGLFDGHRDGVTPSSTAAVAMVLRAPVVLVVDASRMAASVGALALGFASFDPEVEVAAVILNRWNPRRSRTAVAAAIERAGLEVLGYLPVAEQLELPSRHLGLVVADELSAEVEVVVRRLGDHLEEHVDVDRLLALATPAGGDEIDEINESNAINATTTSCGHTTISCGSSDQEGALQTAVKRAAAARAGAASSVASDSPPRIASDPSPRIAVAWDDAFAFYYDDNLRALRAHGAQLVFFSPLAAAALPACDGLYLGGGYPELHVRGLSANEELRRNLAAAVAAGLPLYAECGGLLYLCRSLRDLEGVVWPLVGLVPGDAAMHTRLQSMGYREARLTADCLLGAAGSVVRGHEFRYSSCAFDEGRPSAYICDGAPEGYAAGDLFVSYIHLHFAGCPELLEHWLGRCCAYAVRQGGSSHE